MPADRADLLLSLVVQGTGVFRVTGCTLCAVCCLFIDSNDNKMNNNSASNRPSVMCFFSAVVHSGEM